MKWLILISVVMAAVSASVIKDRSEGYKDGDRFFYFPGDGDGKLHLVDALEPIDEAFILGFVRNPANNGYWLFTRNNRTGPQVLVNGDVNSVLNSYFNVTKETVVLVHGWHGNGNNEMNKDLTAAFLQYGDVNAIVLDWSALANRPYTTAKQGVAEVGRGLGQFLLWLNQSVGLSFDRVHLVGFSLGGHLVGNAGRAVKGQIKRITALDPAGPMWDNDNNRVVHTDARYVEVIHTNTAMYGYSAPCGHSDHYPNGGSSMPGCLLNTCNHSKAWKYMAATVKYNHLLANQCDSQNDASRNKCTGPLQPMGNGDVNKKQSGIFRVNTQRNYPY